MERGNKPVPSSYEDIVPSDLNKDEGNINTALITQDDHKNASR